MNKMMINPEIRRRAAAKRKAWDDEPGAAITQARDDMLKVLPRNVAKCTLADLKELGLPEALAKRMLAKKALHLIVVDSALIERMHIAVLKKLDVGGLDRVELSAFYAALPASFSDNAKADFREDVRKKLVAAFNNDAAPRNNAYLSLPDGIDLSLSNDSVDKDTVVKSGLDSAKTDIADELAALAATRKEATTINAVELFGKRVEARRAVIPKKIDAKTDARVSMLEAIQQRSKPASFLAELTRRAAKKSSSGESTDRRSDASTECAPAASSLFDELRRAAQARAPSS